MSEILTYFISDLEGASLLQIRDNIIKDAQSKSHTRIKIFVLGDLLDSTTVIRDKGIVLEK